MPKFTTRTVTGSKNFPEIKSDRKLKLGSRTKAQVSSASEQVSQGPRNSEELEAFKKVKQVLMSRINIDEREWTGPGRIATHRFVQVGGKLSTGACRKNQSYGRPIHASRGTVTQALYSCA